MSQALTSTSEILQGEAAHNSGLWKQDIVFVRGEGVYLWDADGKRYLDCMAGIAVASVGHANERLVRAISHQAGRLMVCPQNLGNDARAAFLEKLFSFIKPPLNRVFMANSGAEANEAALKWARVATGRKRFVAAKRGFAGRTIGALSVTWEKKYREPFEPLRYEADFISFDRIEDLDHLVTDETAAVMLEPVQGEGGIHPISAGFLQAARELTRERGALLIMDEVQSGAGRTGTFLATEQYGVEADMVTLAKGLGGGFPIGALVMTDEVAAAMPAGGHGTTFGGNPLASAAALAVLEEIEARDLLAHASEVGGYFQEQLAAIPSERIRAVRGLGLMIGLELKEKAAPYIAALMERGVLVINAGATIIRFVPPLIITRDEVDEVVRHVREVLTA
ncbi:MAG: acetylornithine/succinylornithine family transaminase [Trueperaceae bacterium]|nr:MAG: acetylornithine/succinylornithine family transaminase [Trueperaceae bacterium]